jgi:hypothetical protein
MSKKGSALMQVLVIGLIVAAFAVLMLRYAVTRTANLSRSARILEAQIVADSCLDQYMAYQATSELLGEPPGSNLSMNCRFFQANGSVGNIMMNATDGENVEGNYTVTTQFTVNVDVNAGQ